MKTTNPMQLKAFINKMAKEKNIHAQIVMQNYMMERFLERVSVSQHKNNLILKGGFLIATIVGLDTRSTMDLDTTIRGVQLTKEAVQKIFDDISSIPLNDDFSFEVTSIQDIREADAYPGLKVSLRAKYGTLSTPFNIDITAGDRITPREITYQFRLMFEPEKRIDVLAYNLETVLAEKLQTIISRGVRNTRPRDFYDIYIIYKL